MTTIYQLRRATPVQCPPCHGQCQQGRHCNAEAGSARSELLEDDEATEARFRIRTWFWSLYLSIVLAAICAGIAHFLPALKALLSN